MVQQNMWFYQKLVFWYKFTEKINPVFLKRLLEFLFIMSYLNTSDHFFWQVLTEIEKIWANLANESSWQHRNKDWCMFQFALLTEMQNFQEFPVLGLVRIILNGCLRH